MHTMIYLKQPQVSGALLVKLAECLLRIHLLKVCTWGTWGTLSRPLLGKLVLLYLVWAQSVTDAGDDL